MVSIIAKKIAIKRQYNGLANIFMNQIIFFIILKYLNEPIFFIILKYCYGPKYFLHKF